MTEPSFESNSLTMKTASSIQTELKQSILFKSPSNCHVLLYLLNQAFINFPPPVFLLGPLLLQRTNGAEKQTESTTNAE